MIGAHHFAVQFIFKQATSYAVVQYIHTITDCIVLQCVVQYINTDSQRSHILKKILPTKLTTYGKLIPRFAQRTTLQTAQVIYVGGEKNATFSFYNVQ